MNGTHQILTYEDDVNLIGGISTPVHRTEDQVRIFLLK